MDMSADPSQMTVSPILFGTSILEAERLDEAEMHRFAEPILPHVHHA